MTENGGDDFFRVAALAEDQGAGEGMLGSRVMIGVGPAFVIEIVEQSGEGPGIFIAAKFPGVGADAGFDGQGMLAETFALCVFAKQGPGIIAVRHLFSSGLAAMADDTGRSVRRTFF